MKLSTPKVPLRSQSSDRDNPGGFAHIPALDGIRGLAILLVLFDHLFWANGYTGNRMFDFISRLRDSSYVGVDLFFALSGFLITGILLDSLGTPHYFKTFYIRRSLRIFPLYYGFLFSLFCLTPFMHFEWHGLQYFFLTYTANIADRWIHAPLQMGSLNINHFWSLQVEEQFYWIWPLVVYRFRNARTLISLSLTGCGAALISRIVCVLMSHHSGFFGDPYLPYSFTPCCADRILFGACLAVLVRSQYRDLILKFAPYFFSVSVAVLLIIGFLNHGLDWLLPTKYAYLTATAGFSLIGIASASTVALALRPASTTTHLFESRILRFFGKYSYGIYVFHFSIAGLMGPLRSYFDAVLHVKALSVLFGAVIAGGLSVAVACLSYHAYEAPFLRLKRFFRYGQRTSFSASGR